jgi:soluble lytic murein transglycosylase
VHLQRAQKFVAEKAYDLAALELRDLKPRDGLTSPFLVYLAMLDSRAQNYNHAFVSLGDLILRNYEGVFSSYGLRMIFPTPYLELIKKYSVENQLDPILVLSLIKQESAFDEDALSWVGASGLMQLMPQTAVETVPDIEAADLVRAEANILVGTRYLRKLMNKFNGNIVLSLAGYNAGPTAADRWLRDTPAKRGILEFVESIPYKETREYVSSIMRNYYWYSRKLTGEVPKGLNYFWNTYGPPESQPTPNGAAQPKAQSTF